MVDSNLQQWYLTLPPEWHYHTIGIVNEPVEDPATAERWIGEQHVYHDVPLASIVNDYRVCRIFCNRVIMACVSWLAVNPKHDLTSAYKNAVYVIQKMVDEISACVPFHMVCSISRTSFLIVLFSRLSANADTIRATTFNPLPKNSVKSEMPPRPTGVIPLSGRSTLPAARKQFHKPSVTG